MRSPQRKDTTDTVPSDGLLLLDDRETARFTAWSRHPRLPEDLERLIEDYISRKVGRHVDDPVILDRIRGSIARQKGLYWKEGEKRRIPYGKGYDVLGYLAYQAPVYIVQFEHILFQLAKDGLLKRDLAVLDAGTGPGVVPLAIIDFFRRVRQDCRVRIHAIEQAEEHLEAYRFLVPAFQGNEARIVFHAAIQADIRTVSADALPGDIDLIVFQNVLNEVPGEGEEDRAAIVRRFLPSLREDGTLLIIEPADRANATGLRKLAGALAAGGLGLYGPCTFIRGSRCRPDDCWTFEEKPPIRPTNLMKMLAASTTEPYRYINTDIKYASAVLRKDFRTREEYRVPTGARYARHASLHRHIGRTVDTAGAVMSGDIGDDKTHVFKLCDGTAARPVYAILPSYHITDANRHLLAARYGSIIIIGQVLVRHNPRHDAFNLLVNRQSRVSPAGSRDARDDGTATGRPRKPSRSRT